MLSHAPEPPDIETSTMAYADRFSGPIGNYLLDVQADGVRQLLAGLPLKGGQVLEVGGGHAQLTGLLLALGVEVWVQGSAPSCAERLSALREQAGGRLHFVTSNLLSLPFADRTFDLVIGIRLLAHVERWEALLAEMARVCRRCVLVEYPPIGSANALEPWLFSVKRFFEHNTRPFACFSKRQLAPVLRDLDLGDLSECKQFVLPVVVHRVLKRPQLSRRIEALGRRLGLTSMIGGPALLLAQRPSARLATPAPQRPSDRSGGPVHPDPKSDRRARGASSYDHTNRQPEGASG